MSMKSKIPSTRQGLTHDTQKSLQSKPPRRTAQVRRQVEREAERFLPKGPIDQMQREACHCALTAGMVFVAFGVMPAILVSALVCATAQRIRRRSYYEREKKRRIELRDGRRMKLHEYAQINDIVQGTDGQFYVYDREEFARRVRLEHDRRRVRRHQTLNAMPTRMALLKQWAKVKNSHKDMIRFGSMLCDLEAFVDNGLIRDDNGAIKGRRPGVKGWLAEHCVEIARHYSKAMRYKAMAVKLRQAVGMEEPYPATMALEEETASPTSCNGKERNKTLVGISENVINKELKKTDGAKRGSANAKGGENAENGAGANEDGGQAQRWRRMASKMLKRAKEEDDREGEGRATQAAMERAIERELKPGMALVAFEGRPEGETPRTA